MQAAVWYLNRLRTMSPQEISWRFKSLCGNHLDRILFAAGLFPALPARCRSNAAKCCVPGFRVFDNEMDCTKIEFADEDNPWRSSLIKRAERICSHRLSFFNLEDHFLGETIDWNCEPAHGKKPPLAYAPSIDYRDFDVTGDCKFVWEPNRHHQLVVLARAFRATGERRFAQKAADFLLSWMNQCPFSKGMNWRSPLELGIRLINWVWTIDLIRGTGVLKQDFSRLLHVVYLHMWEIVRKYSKGSSSNNHLVGEAAGVFTAASYFHALNNCDNWREQSRNILIRELRAQIYPDGCTREQATGYHLFSLQFFLIAGLVGQRTNWDFPREYWRRLEKMIEFVAAMQSGGESLPMFGDADDGYVLDLGGGPPAPKDLLCVGAILFQRPDFKALSGGFSEYAFWLLGKQSRKRFESLDSIDESEHLKPHAFPYAGYYVLQSGHYGKDDRISLVFDCGDLGFKSIAAHGHADALSFTLRVFGKDVLVDPGTYDYFTYPEWRAYFRSTRAHNAVVIDGKNQSEMLGPFMWGKRAACRCVEWKPGAEDGGGLVSGIHDGYQRLRRPALHRRTIELDAKSSVVSIDDEIITAGTHDIAIFFHTAEYCRVFQEKHNRIFIGVAGRVLCMEMDRRLSVEIFRGTQCPIAGWVSRRYHVKENATTIKGQLKCTGNAKFTTKIRVCAKR